MQIASKTEPLSGLSRSKPINTQRTPNDSGVYSAPGLESPGYFGWEARRPGIVLVEPQ